VRQPPRHSAALLDDFYNAMSAGCEGSGDAVAHGRNDADVVRREMMDGGGGRVGVGRARKGGGRRRRRRGFGANGGRGTRVVDDVVDGTTRSVIIGYGHCTCEMKQTQRKN
jgi:hypothetical protein